jgi:hypothetical protein
MGPQFMGNLLNTTKVQIDEWLAPVPADLANPLYAEQNFQNFNASGKNLLSFGDNRTNSNGEQMTIADFLVDILKDPAGLLGNSQVNPDTGAEDLGINAFLRDTVLDADGTLMLNMSTLGPDFNPVIFNSQGLLTETSMTISGIQVTGLDTLQAFSPFQTIGNFTLSNDFVWKTLSVDVNLTLDIKPSTRPDSILVGSGDVQILEEISVSIDMNDLNVTFALFMAVNRDKFNALTIGSLLRSRNLLPCLLSSTEAFEISDLQVTIGDLSQPNLSGFVSPGIDRLVSTAAEAAFVAFEPTLLRAIPGLFQTTVRSILEDRFLGQLIKSDSESNKCPSPELIGSTEGASLDFRELFLEPAIAKKMGATGNRQYGDFGPIVFNLIQKRFLTLEGDGLPMINDLLIRKYTDSQSGVKGMLRFNETVLDFGTKKGQTSRLLTGKIATNLTENIFFSVGDIRIRNLDTIVLPLELLNATNEVYTLNNIVNMGTGLARPLNATIRITAGVRDYVNELDLSASIDSLVLLADVYAKVDTSAFMKFPLGDVLNYKCWLASLPAVTLDENGFAADPTEPRGLSLSDLKASIASFAVDVSCISCTSPGADLLPELLQILRTQGVIDTVGARLPSLIDSLSTSETTETLLDRWIAEAPKSCPSSSEYDENAVVAKYATLGFPALSASSLDTLLFVGVVASGVASVVFAETQRLSKYVPTEPLSAQTNFVAPEGIQLVDFTNLGNSTGFGGIADQLFDRARKIVGGDGGTIIDFKEILGNVVGDNSFIEVQTNFEFKSGGLALSLDYVRVEGLDSLSMSNFVEPIGPQTLSSSAQFETLKLDLSLSASVPSSKNTPQVINASFLLQNVTADIVAFAAFDIDKIGKLQLGSLLDVDQLFKCILSSAYEFGIPQMKVSIGSFSNPALDGLMPETINVAQMALDTIFDRFRPNIEEAIPLIFDGIGKDMIASMLISADNRTCLSKADEFPPQGLVDFPDLLLPQNEALARGGTGEAQYGGLVSKVYKLIQEKFMVLDPETGLAVLNRKFLAKLGEAQSGTPGRLFFAGDIVNQVGNVKAGGLNAFFTVRLFDAYINNFDTVGVPFVFLDPLDREAHTLNNSGSVGNIRPVQVGIKMLLGLSGEGTYLRHHRTTA